MGSLTERDDSVIHPAGHPRRRGRPPRRSAESPPEGRLAGHAAVSGERQQATARLPAVRPCSCETTPPGLGSVVVSDSNYFWRRDRPEPGESCAWIVRRSPPTT